MNRLFWDSSKQYFSIEKIKENLLAESKNQVKNVLANTDWYITRLSDEDSQQKVPLEVRALRLEARVQRLKQENLIKAASTIDELEDLFDNDKFEIKKHSLEKEDFENFKNSVAEINKKLEPAPTFTSDNVSNSTIGDILSYLGW
jgi:hypothetical protein